MDKSIMDATGENGIGGDEFPGVRNFLVTHGIHNFDAQEQGVGSRALVKTKLLANGRVIDTQTSLYRPNTKDGDPRIWIYELGQHADAYDLLAITKGNDGGLAVINCSKSDLVDVLNHIHP